VSSLTENTEETNEARHECAERDISEWNIRSQIESSEFSLPAAHQMKQRKECSKFLKKKNRYFKT
jgi:hypothetical protein